MPKFHSHTIIFDCDGVILDSNSIKTRAFHSIASQFRTDAAEKLVRYHLEHGGRSRYNKFEYLFNEILEIEAPIGEIDRLSCLFSNMIFDDMLICPIADGLLRLREVTRDSTWLIVSGSDQIELREIIATRGLSGMFNGGIFGSPEVKTKILRRQIEQGTIKPPAVFIGDSRTDYESAMELDIPFIFLTEWSATDNWDEFIKDNESIVAGSIKDIIPLFTNL